jgi:hypothetical protein
VEDPREKREMEKRHREHMGLNPNEAIVIQIIVIATRSGTVGRTIYRNNSWTGRADLSIVRGR